MMVNHTGRAEVLPGHLVPSGELDTNGPADCMREQGCVEGDRVCAVKSIAAGAPRVDDAHVLRLDVEQLRHNAAGGIRRLRGGVHRGASRLDIRYGTGGTDRAMHLKRELVAGVNRGVRGFHLRWHVAGVDTEAV